MIVAIQYNIIILRPLSTAAVFSDIPDTNTIVTQCKVAWMLCTADTDPHGKNSFNLCSKTIEMFSFLTFGGTVFDQSLLLLVCAL